MIGPRLRTQHLETSLWCDERFIKIVGCTAHPLSPIDSFIGERQCSRRDATEHENKLSVRGLVFPQWLSINNIVFVKRDAN